MSKDQEALLDEIRERVLERERELRLKEDKEASIQATLQALEEITEVPREEMERIADEIRAAHNAPETVADNLPERLSPVLEDLPATVKEALSKLPPVLRDEFHEEYLIQHRSLPISYLLWLIPPPLSCHYLFNRRIFTQILFTLTCGGVFLWWLVDIFRLPQTVADENRKSARRILKKLMRHPLNRKINR
jgi:hypothetical protein